MKNLFAKRCRQISFWLLGSAAATLLVAACGRDEPAATTPTAGADAPQAPATAATALPRTPAPQGARVFFITPEDGATVTNPVKVEFGIEGMDVVPAGTLQAQSGHHHLLVDTGLPDLSKPIPADANHLHFGDGSTSTELTLSAGQHRLRLL